MTGVSAAPRVMLRKIVRPRAAGSHDLRDPTKIGVPYPNVGGVPPGPPRGAGAGGGTGRT